MAQPSETPNGASETEAIDFAVDPANSSSPTDAQAPETTMTPESPALESPRSPTGEGYLGRMPPSARSISEQPSMSRMTASSTPLGSINNARRPNNLNTSGANSAQDIQAKMRAFHRSRQGPAPTGRPSMTPHLSTGSTPQTSSGFGGLPGGVSGFAGGLQSPGRPMAQNVNSAPAVSQMPPMGGMKRANRPGGLPGGLPGALPSRPKPKMTLSDMNGPPVDGEEKREESKPENMFSKFSQFVDTKNGTLKFDGKAVIHGGGIDFSSGSSFNISLDEVDTLEELGKGNYGTVYKVRHTRPRMRRPGLGLSGIKPTSLSLPQTPAIDIEESSPPIGGTSGIVMAMKEIRLELDEAKFAAIIMELDVLHRCVSPYIIDFYGAFFQEGAVYICMEFMDGGSIDKLYGDGMPENVLRKVTYATTQGLKVLKDGHNIIHRDVKPTNILVNSRGQVKICDFGVSGNLVASIAKTNIGCQSYMAPERIAGGGIAQAGANPGGGTYSVQSDIWSLGLSIIECAMGRYPYPPETYNNIFSQLSAIVDGDPPDLPEEGYSPLARDFVRGCLNKIPKLRPSYSMLLNHGWLAPLSKPETISEEDEEAAEAGTLELNSSDTTEDREVAEWVLAAIEKKRAGKLGISVKPALHAAPLDSVSPAVSPAVKPEGFGEVGA